MKIGYLNINFTEEQKMARWFSFISMASSYLSDYSRFQLLEFIHFSQSQI